MAIYSFNGFVPVIKESSFVHPRASVTGNVLIGEDVYIGPGAAIRGDWGQIIIEDGCNVQENCTIHMFPGTTVLLKKGAHIGHGAIIHGGTIGENCLIGMNAVIMDDVVMEDECIIGALSFVPAKMHLPKRSLAVGNPAKIVKQVSDEMIAWKTKGTALYQALPGECHATLQEVEPLREVESNRPAQESMYATWEKIKKMSRKEHWETVYETKTPEQVSWTEEIPRTSLEFIHSFGTDKSVSIIDIGGGDSHLVDHLLDEGYTNISVLDISAKALDRARKRLGDRAKNVIWIESDITDFQPELSYSIWHDRAVFHFLTDETEIAGYIRLVEKAVDKNMVIGTFSENGPLRCSALDISQYSTEELSDRFSENFEVLECMNIDHTTPFDTVQNFSFCGFKRR